LFEEVREKFEREAVREVNVMDERASCSGSDLISLWLLCFALLGPFIGVFAGALLTERCICCPNVLSPSRAIGLAIRLGIRW
jgi:hypothetical protein